ncbi:hypothetical protein CBR_g8842 [Chara braunii]|uniref:Uncharacterized protein n=1 Tax=Chara braunii TaxID=69332 RepID=A0A388KMZ4_CHABU|nr:hypothetical protein CBR_g8842 [Chara braunii]|eukprot:GBG71422.1 hypothetical protein CBR_g8842 [Chara braunii]
MSFVTERALDDHLLTPRGYISAIRLVRQPRFNLDLLRLTQFFYTSGVYAAAEFRFAGSPQAVVLAETVVVHRRSAPGISHVSTVVGFSGDISTSDESPIPHVLTRTLTPYLQWSACLEEPGTSRNPPLQRDYLDPWEIIHLAFFQVRAASEDEEIEIEEESVEEEEAAEEDEEEETPEEGSYSEHSEGEQCEGEEEDEEDEEELELEESKWEISAEELERTEVEQAEDPEAACKRDEIAAVKRQLEFASMANLPITEDPARDPEPPKLEDGEQAETSSAPWRRWREHFVDLSVCLIGVRITWTKDEEHREWFEYLELMIVQAWRTDVEGDLRGFLYGSVRPSHRQPITLELTVPFAQLANDLPLEIVSQSDDIPVPYVLTRTLTLHLQRSACLEEPGTSCNPPSQRDYLDSWEIIDLTFFQDRAASEDEEIAIEEESADEEKEEAAEEDEEEETPEEGSYSEHKEGEQSEGEEEDEEEEEELELEESEWEISVEGLERIEAEQAEDPEAARKRDEITAGKRQLEFASAANLLISDDPARDPEPPKPEDGEQAETSSAPAGRRRSRSPSPSRPDRPSVRARTYTGHRASSPVVIPPSPSLPHPPSDQYPCHLPP